MQAQKGEDHCGDDQPDGPGPGSEPPDGGQGHDRNVGADQGDDPVGREAMPYYEEAPWLIAAPTAVLLWLVAAMMLIQPEREAA